MSTESAKPALSQEAIVAQFQQLRNEQRNLVNSLNTLEMDLREHKWVTGGPKMDDPSVCDFGQVGESLQTQWHNSLSSLELW